MELNDSNIKKLRWLIVFTVVVVVIGVNYRRVFEVFMMLFGLGTLPFMFAVVLAGNLMSQNFRRKVLQFVPVMMIIMGGLFVLRGLELGIPYISPNKEAMKISSESADCCNMKGTNHQHSEKPSCH